MTSDGQSDGTTIPDPAEKRRLRASYKIGIDANRPVHPKTGIIQPQVADPRIIASTGSGWVRLNFLQRPWEHPLDDTLYQGRTWRDTYGKIISGFRAEGLRIYGLIGCEAMPKIPRDEFRSPPPHGDVIHGWLEDYAEQFATIAKLFKDDIQILESFNEPDDWHGQNRNWIHASWFAIMLQKIYTTVRNDPQLKDIVLVSGPLQGLQANSNGPVHYLRATYQAGKEIFGWGEDGVAFPFDGVGYHIYVKSGYTSSEAQQERAIRKTFRNYLAQMHRLIRKEEGVDKPLFVSELGWTSNLERDMVRRREEFQANSLSVGLDMVLNDPLVGLGFAFCTQDFRIESRDEFYGLYRMGDLTPANRKKAFHAFRTLCQREVELPAGNDLMEWLEDLEGDVPETEAVARAAQYSNQQVIEAFYHAAADLGFRNRWALLKKAGLNLYQLASDRKGRYAGQPIEEMEQLTAAERRALLARLGTRASKRDPVAFALAQAPKPVPAGADRDTGDAGSLDTEMDLELTLALQEELIGALEQVRDLLREILARLPAPAADGPGDGPGG